MTRPESKTVRRLTGSVAAVIVLALCLCVTSYALVYEAVTVPDNLFTTGTVTLDLNGGAPVIQEDEFVFEPGMTVRKSFYLRSESSCEVYYRFYLADVSGDLADVLQITVTEGGRTVCSGTAAQLDRAAVAAAEDDRLSPGQTRTFEISFHYPESAGNRTQGKTLSFTLCAEAVQTRNNPSRQF